MSSPAISRNTFLKFAVVFVGSGGALASAACSSSDDSSTGGSSGTSGTSGSSSGSSGSSGSSSGSSGTSSGSSGTSSGSSGTSSGSSGSSGTDSGTDAGVDAPVASCTDDGAKDSLITANHMHSLEIPAADFAAPSEQTYHILGMASHDHLVTLTGAQLTMIAAGTSVTVLSTMTNMHTHMVTVVCA